MQQMDGHISDKWVIASEGEYSSYKSIVAYWKWKIIKDYTNLDESHQLAVKFATEPCH